MTELLGDRPALIRWCAHGGFWLSYFALRTAAAIDPGSAASDLRYLINRAAVVSTYAVLTGVLLALIAGPRAQRSSGACNIALALGALALAPLTQYGEIFWPQQILSISPAFSPFVVYCFQFAWVLALWGLMQAMLGYHFEALAQRAAALRSFGRNLRPG